MCTILTVQRKATHTGLGDVGSSPRVSSLMGIAAADATLQCKTCRCFQEKWERRTEPQEGVPAPSRSIFPGLWGGVQDVLSRISTKFESEWCRQPARGCDQLLETNTSEGLTRDPGARFFLGTNSAELTETHFHDT